MSAFGAGTTGVSEESGEKEVDEGPKSIIGNNRRVCFYICPEGSAEKPILCALVADHDGKLGRSCPDAQDGSTLNLSSRTHQL